MNFGNSKRSKPHRLLLNLSDKINLKRSDKYVAYQILYVLCLKCAIRLKCSLHGKM